MRGERWPGSGLYNWKAILMHRTSTNFQSQRERFQANTDFHQAAAQQLHDRLTHIGHKTGGTVVFLKRPEGG